MRRSVAKSAAISCSKLLLQRTLVHRTSNIIDGASPSTTGAAYLIGLARSPGYISIEKTHLGQNSTPVQDQPSPIEIKHGTNSKDKYEMYSHSSPLTNLLFEEIPETFRFFSCLLHQSTSRLLIFYHQTDTGRKRCKIK